MVDDVQTLTNAQGYAKYVKYILETLENILSVVDFWFPRSQHKEGNM